MEKGQTSDDVSFFLKSAYESKVFFVGGWIPGFPKENYMDFLLQLKFSFVVTADQSSPGVSSPSFVNLNDFNITSVRNDLKCLTINIFL